MNTRWITFILAILAALAFAAKTLATPANAEPSATYTVNANTDLADALPGDGICETVTGNGMCTLRAAVMEANAHIGGDTIVLPDSTYNLTILGAGEDNAATGDLDITESVTITGDQNGVSLIDATSLGDRVFDIKDTAGQVSISWVQVQHGLSTDDPGGGILSRASLILNDVHLISNQSIFHGGALFIANAPLYMENCYFFDNRAGVGGAVEAYNSDFSSTNTVFSSNYALSDGGALQLSGFGNSARVISNTFESNIAVADGGGIYNQNTEFFLQDSTFNFNDAQEQCGGGLVNVSSMGTIHVSNVKFIDNSAICGGGIYNSVGKIEMEDSLVEQNTAETNEGGGIYNGTFGDITLSNVQLKNNSASLGGGIYNAGTNLFVNYSTLESNTAPNGGGGIYNAAGSNLSLSHVTVLANTTNSNGGGLYNLGSSIVTDNSLIRNNSAFAGAGIYNDAGASLTLTNVEFLANSNPNDGAGLNNHGGAVQISGSKFWWNGASVSNGGGISNCCGGTIDLSSTGFYNNHSSGYGGAIINNGSGSLIVADLVTFDNNSSGAGGGISVLNGSGLTIDQASFYHNSGAAIYNYLSGVILTDSSLISNTGGIGGGIWSNGLFAIENSTISENYAPYKGGGIYNEGILSVYNSTLTSNSTGVTGYFGYVGGGIFAADGSSSTIRNSILYNNHSYSFNLHDDDCAGTITTQHYNLFGTLTGCTLANDQGLDLVALDPLLGPQGYYNGPTELYPLLPNSPAIDAANPAGCVGESNTLLEHDQRGYLRHWDGNGDGVKRCDIGSFEFGSVLQIFLPIAIK